MTIEEILDEMETLLLEAGRVPFTNKRVIEEDEFAKLLDDLRDTLPNEFSEANQIIKERQRILDEAKREAQHIVDQAKQYTAKLTDENSITRQAQEQAQEFMAQAKKNAHHLQADAVDYADSVFSHMENSLEKALQVVRQGHNELKQSKPIMGHTQATEE